MPLPPRHLRPGGPHSTDALWIERGRADAEMLRERAGLDSTSRLLDWGSGPGRMLAGIDEVVGPIKEYIGVDVKADVIRWATQNLTTNWSRFIHVPQQNDRYNPDGETSHAIDVGKRSFDIICGFSVFTHMRSDDVLGYSRELARLLRPNGQAVLTAFVEPEVPDEVENPPDYLPELTWSGPLHCVRYEHDYFYSLLEAGGLSITEFVHGNQGGTSLVIAQQQAPSA